jgi:hypothetical protein
MPKRLPFLLMPAKSLPQRRLGQASRRPDKAAHVAGAADGFAANDLAVGWRERLELKEMSCVGAR